MPIPVLLADQQVFGTRLRGADLVLWSDEEMRAVITAADQATANPLVGLLNIIGAAGRMDFGVIVPTDLT